MGYLFYQVQMLYYGDYISAKVQWTNIALALVAIVWILYQCEMPQAAIILVLDAT